MTWKSERISSSSDSNSASDLSISSISSTQPSGCSSACSSGRGSTNSLEKNTSPKSCSWSSAACSVCGAAEHFAELVLQDLGVEQLLGVFPLIERLGLVEAFVALQADHLQAAPGRDRLGKLGLADAGRAFDQDRLLDLLRQIDGGRDLPARDIALRGEAALDCLDRGRGLLFSHEKALPKVLLEACSACVPGKEQASFGRGQTRANGRFFRSAQIVKRATGADQCRSSSGLRIVCLTSAPQSAHS